MVGGDMMPWRCWLWVAAWVVCVVGLPWLGRSIRHARDERCELDGQPIDYVYRVSIVDTPGTRRQFCCLACAQHWLKRAPHPSTIFVTDEISGREVPAAQAYYVRSSVVTQPATGNRLHAFARREDAVRHARQGRGTILPREENPFSGR